VSPLEPPTFESKEEAEAEALRLAARKDRRLCVFAKLPDPGRVKTRLVPAIKESDAAWLYMAFLNDLTEELMWGPYSLYFLWALEEGEKVPAHEIIRSDVQSPGDLGARLYDCCEKALREVEAVLVLGSDHPEFQKERAVEAFEKLEEGHDVVLGPTPDGGYYLIGMRRSGLRPELFSAIPWSTEKVFETTLERCREAGLTCAILPQGFDIDTPADLDALAVRLRHAPRERCGFTRVLLKEWGRL